MSSFIQARCVSSMHGIITSWEYTQKTWITILKATEELSCLHVLQNSWLTLFSLSHWKRKISEKYFQYFWISIKFIGKITIDGNIVFPSRIYINAYVIYVIFTPFNTHKYVGNIVFLQPREVLINQLKSAV